MRTWGDNRQLGRAQVKTYTTTFIRVNLFCFIIAKVAGENLKISLAIVKEKKVSPDKLVKTRAGQGEQRAHSRMLEDPIYKWGCKYLYQDNATNLVTVLILQSYVTNLTKITHL